MTNEEVQFMLERQASELQRSTIARKFALGSVLPLLVDESEKPFYDQLYPITKLQARILIPLIHQHSTEASVMLVKKLAEFGIKFNQARLEEFLQQYDKKDN